jgi:hypothetical protein
MSTEQQRYDVIEKIGKNIEIRQYPKRIVAETTTHKTIMSPVATKINLM